MGKEENVEGGGKKGIFFFKGSKRISCEPGREVRDSEGKIGGREWSMQSRVERGSERRRRRVVL